MNTFPLAVLRARAACLRVKAADAGDVAQGAAGVGAIGLAANWARNTANRVPPSLLQLAERLWRDPENAKRLAAPFVDDEHGRRAARLIAERPWALRQILLGRSVAGVIPEHADAIRHATFGDPGVEWNPHRVDPPGLKPGQLILHAKADEMVSNAGRRAAAVSGNPLNHTAIVGDKGGVYNFAENPTGGPRGVIQGLRNQSHAFVRFADRALTPAQQEALKTVIPETYERTAPGGGKVPFDYKKLSDLQLREGAPELASRSGRSVLSPGLNWLANNRTASRYAKRHAPADAYKHVIGYRRLGATCGPGEVCSTMAGRALENVGAKVSPEMTPGDVMRNAKPGGRFSPVEIHLPTHMRTPEYLVETHRARLKPAIARAPAIAGLGLLGANMLYGATKSGCDGFLAMAARAAILREKVATREFETGLGVPQFGAPIRATPLTADEAARVVSTVPPSPPARRPPPAPVVGGRSPLESLLPRTRGGRQGLLAAGAAALAGGLGLGAAARANRPEGEALGPNPARESVRQAVVGGAGDAAGTFWSRMVAKYGRRRPPPPPPPPPEEVLA